MSRLAIIEPKTLMGDAVRENLGDQQETWSEVELFTADSEEVGGVSEVGGRAALVQALESDGLATFDSAIFCGHEVDPKLLRSLSSSCKAIVIEPESPLPDSSPVVAGVNEEEAIPSPLVTSPGPAVLMLAHMLHPLQSLGHHELVAHVLYPASMRGKEALDELFGQTQNILSMSDQRPSEVFGSQLAFNLLPWHGAAGAPASELRSILKTELDARIFLTQAGVFHGCSACLSLRFTDDPGAEQLTELLQESPLVEFTEDPLTLGPVAAVASDKILIGEVTTSGVKGYGLWCCMDNLTLGARNALAIARQ